MNRLRKKCYLLCATFGWVFSAAFLLKPPMGCQNLLSWGKLGGQIIIIVILVLIMLRYINFIGSSLEGYTHKPYYSSGKDNKWNAGTTPGWLCCNQHKGIPFSSPHVLARFICQANLPWLFPVKYYCSAPTLFLTHSGLFQVWEGPYLATKMLSDLKSSLISTTWNILHKITI